MGDEEKYDSLPIPTYEEATSSRPNSAQSFLGAEHTSHDAERQGLLGRVDNGGGTHGLEGYRQPTVESVRDSLDSEYFLASSHDGSSRASEERREVFEMDVLDPTTDPSSSSSSQLRNRLNKSLTTLTSTLSSFRLPFDFQNFSLSSVRSYIPKPGSHFFLILARILAMALIAFFVYLLFFSTMISGRRSSMGQPYDPSAVKQYVQSHVDGTSMRDSLKHLTSFSHVAGDEGDYFLAKWVQGEFKRSGLESVELKEYQVYLNYPKDNGRRVAIVEPQEQAWEAKIEEDRLYPDADDARKKQSPVFHGHSKSGNVTGHLIFANFGSREDFKYLKDNGIQVEGSIALVKYYGTQSDRALKILAAQQAGAVGCIIYSDPSQDGFVTGPAWPDGPRVPSDGVQRGGVSLMNWIVGDVLTPGWASTPDAERIPIEDNPGLLKIPSIPLAWRDAQHLLQSLKGHGRKVPRVWIGGVPDIDEWYTGDDHSPLVNLMNFQDEVAKQPIWNVLGRIVGVEQSEKAIILGNHRDAWCFGSADPGSGTAVLLEVARIFGDLVRLGWKPLRSIVFASWDGEEYNLIGSTEWVEDNMEELRQNGFAYVNVDVAVSGPNLRAAGSPVFQSTLLRALDRVEDPNANQTLRSAFDAQGHGLEGLGAGSDYVAFQDMAGCSSIDLGFTGEPYPYHSCYDSFEWMDKYGDPGFGRHRALAQVIALLILELADKPVLPFDLGAYSSAISTWTNDIETEAKQMNHDLDFAPLREASDKFGEIVKLFEKIGMQWTSTAADEDVFESRVEEAHRISHNTRMANFETHLLDLEGRGLKGREQFKHIIFAPQAWNGYGETFFPSIRDRIDEGDWEAAQQAIHRVAEILRRAAEKLLN